MKKKKHRTQKFFCLLLAGMMLVSGIVPYTAYALEQSVESELCTEAQRETMKETRNFVSKASEAETAESESVTKGDLASESAKPDADETSESSREVSAEAVDITETLPEETKEEILSVEAEEQKAVVDELTMQYLKDHVDRRYSGAEKIELVNVLRVKQTLADRKTTSSDETIDGMFASEKVLEKYLATVGAFVAVYNLDDASDYYVSYANTMQKDDADLTDWVFAKNNVDGEVVEGCILDEKTGIAYIPKSLSKNEKGEELLNSLQVQMLQRVSFGDELSSKVQTVTNTENALQATVVKSGVFDESVVVQTEKGLDAEDLVVSANGIPLVKEDEYHYNAATGEVELSASAASIQTVSICQEETGLAEKIAKALRPKSVQALSKWTDMKPFKENIEIPDWVTTGTYFTGKAPYAYNGLGTTEGYNFNTYAYAVAGKDYASDTTVDQLAGLIYNGGTADVSKVNEIKKGLYIRFTFYSQQPAYTASGKTITANWTSPSQGSGKAMDWSQFGASALRLVCGHASKPYLGKFTGPTGGKYALMPAAVRFLKVDRTAGYAVLGILTCTTHSQEGVGMVRITLPKYGYLQIKKTDKDNGKNVSGAVYEVFELKNNKYVKVKDVSTGNYAVLTSKADGLSNIVKLSLSADSKVFYIREKTPPDGYRRDETYYKVTVKAEKYGTAAADAKSKTLKAVADKPEKAYLYIRKTDPNPATYKFYYPDTANVATVGGYKYEVFTDAACTKLAVQTAQNEGQKAILTTSRTKNSEGYYSNKVVLKPGTYYVKESETLNTFSSYKYNSDVIKVTLVDGQKKEIGSNKEIQNKPRYGYMYIVKSDKDNPGIKLKGAEYGVYRDMACTKIPADEFTGKAARLVTDASGESNLVKLRLWGTEKAFALQEEIAPIGYKLNSEPVKVIVVEATDKMLNLEKTLTGDALQSELKKLVKAQGMEFSMTDEQEDKTPIQLKKVDSKDPTKVLAGAVYYVYTDAACKTRATELYSTKYAVFKTTKKGSNNIYLAPGTYYIKEQTPPKGYKKNETPTKVVITQEQLDKQIPIIITEKDDLEYGRVILKKTDSTSPKKIVADARYGIYASEADAELGEETALIEDVYGNPAILTTTSKGSNAVCLPVGTYYIRELESPDGYLLNETPIPVTITANMTVIPDGVTEPDPVLVETEDKPEPQEASLIKHSTADPNLVVIGAEYYVYTDEGCLNQAMDVDGNPAVLITTDMGSNTVSLNPGTYYVKEFKPAEGFLVNETVYPVTLTAGGAPAVIEAEDAPDSITCSLEKVSSAEPTKILANAVFDVYADEEASEQALDVYGNPAVFTTTDTGSNLLELYPGTYYLKEKIAPEGYELSEELIPFTAEHTEDGSPIKIPVYNEPEKGTASLIKTSTEDPNEIVVGAVYNIYKDSECTEQATEVDGTPAAFVTDFNGSNIVTLYIGTYYFKEVNAPTGFKKDETVHTLVITKDTENTPKEPIPVEDEPGEGRLKLVKVNSIKPTEMVPGAVYGVYNNESAQEEYLALDVNGENAIFTTTETGSNILTMPAGSYYVKEITAPEGFEKNELVYEVEVTAENLDDPAVVALEPNTLEVSDTPKGILSLLKESSLTSMTDGNPCYSLAGAVYEVYSDEALTMLVAELITTEDGTTNEEYLTAGTYYIKEKTAPYGYKLCDGTLDDGSDANGIHVVTVAAGEKAVVHCKEKPIHDPFSLRLQKLDADTGEPVAVGSASLEGAQFEVTYFTNIEGTTDGTPTRTWVFKTDAKGQMRTFDESYLVVEKSDLLYKDEFGGIIYPLGTYHIKEIQPPLYYQMEGEMTFRGTTTSADVKEGVTLVIAEENDRVQITQGGRRIEAGNLALDVTEKVYKGSVTIWKKDESGSEPLSGVEFVLTAPDGTTMKQTTNADGKAVFDGLIPQEYTLTEVKTVDGHSLLADNITVTIPMSMTEEELIASGADKTKAVWDEATGTYCFFDVTYTVTNSVTLDMPMTGGNPVWLYLMMGMAAVCIVTGVYFRRRTH